jgi:hypothetical protein
MATGKLTDDDLRRVEEMAKRWGKFVVRERWGERGPGLDVTLDQMEEVAWAAVRGLLAGTLELATQQQADYLGPSQPCPDCGRMCPLVHEDRPIVVRSGSTFEHQEPKGHCPACRRDFFPSAGAVTVDQSRLQPGDVGQDC